MYNVFVLIFALFLSLIASAGMNISPGTGVHTHADGNTGGGTLTVSGTLSSTKACATGFIRVTPNYCRRTTGTSEGGWVDATACTSRSPSGITLPADATAVVVVLYWQALSASAIADRFNSVIFSTNAACSINQVTSNYSVREFAAVAAGTIIARAALMYIVPLTGTNTIHTTQTNAGGNGNADVSDWFVAAYFD